MARLGERERSAAQHPRKTPSTYWMGNQLRGAPPRCLRDAIIHHYRHYRPPSIPRFTPGRRAESPASRSREESSVTRIATRSGPDLPRPDVVPRASRYAPSRGISSRRRATESRERITRRVSAVAEPLNRDGVLPRASVVGGSHSRIASTGCANLGAPMGDSRAAPFI